MKSAIARKLSTARSTTGSIPRFWSWREMRVNAGLDWYV